MTACGTVLSLLPKTPFDASNLATAGKQEMTLAKALPVSSFRSGVLQVRIHQKSISGSGSFDVFLVSALPSRHEPNLDFVSAERLASVRIETSTTANLLEAALRPGLGGFLRLGLVALQGTSLATLTATLSAQLVLRT